MNFIKPKFTFPYFYHTIIALKKNHKNGLQIQIWIKEAHNFYLSKHYSEYLRIVSLVFCSFKLKSINRECFNAKILIRRKFIWKKSKRN